MKIEQMYEVTIQGIRPMLMHNSRLGDPLNEHAKKLKTITSLKSKTDEDHVRMGRVEFEGGLYWDDEIGLYIPADNFIATMIEGAKKRRLGKEFKAYVNVIDPLDTPGYPLEYTGPKTIDGMWNDPNFVFRKNAKVAGKQVMRTRCRIPSGWRVTYQVEILAGGINKAQLKEAIEMAGMLHGLGDWRPRYGRFILESLKEI